MIRLSLLQFRVQAITAAAVMAAFAVLLAATGPHLASMYAADGLDSCHGSSCASLADYFTGSLIRSPYEVLWLLSEGIILIAPAVIGLFWGAPLNFATHGITPLGYAAFAFALGVTAGALIRRTIPAMAITLAIFAALQVAMPLWVRPNLAPPDHTVIPVTSLGGALPSQTGPGGTSFTLYAPTIPGQPGAWLLSSGAVNAAGQATSTTPAACTSVGSGPGGGAQGNAFGPGQGPAAFVACLASHGIREAITYQPASRYWRFQTTETAIYLALALALAAYCFRRLNRRLS